MEKVKKYSAETFDLMQYFYGSVHDPLIHCLIRLSVHIDEMLLKKAVTLSLAAIPMIRCCFDSSSRRPAWKDNGFTGDDIVRMFPCEADDTGQSMGLLVSTIDIAHEPQLRINVIRGKESGDTLCLVINHMVCDGSGFKEYIYLLCELYTKLLNDVEYKPDPKFYPRGAGQLFKGIGAAEKLGILFSKYDLSWQSHKTSMKLAGDTSNPFIVTRRIEKAELASIKAYAKSMGASVNDMFMTAYIRLLSRRTGKERIVIPCPVDLRKYIPKTQKHGICNLTSNYCCDVTVRGEDSFRDTLAEVSRQMKLQKDSSKSLKSVIMLELAFRVLPYRFLKRNFEKFFTIPVVSYTNLGVMDGQLLRFGDIDVTEAFLTGAIKYVPYFQVAVSTYDDCCTLTCNLHGTPGDRIWIESFLEGLAKELLDRSGE